MNLTDKIKNYKVVSFDLYDTLIKRNVIEPKEVFDIVAAIYAEKKEGFDKQRYIKERNLAFKKAKAINENCRLSDIYSAIAYDREISRELEKIEENVEINISIPNKAVIDIFLWAVKNEKEVIILSDMYLSKQVILQIINRCGICIDESKVFVSCDTGKSKIKGDLYDYVSERLQINKTEWIHVGDGKKNDYIRAEMKGLHACLLPKYITYNRYCKFKGRTEKEIKDFRRIKALTNNLIPFSGNEYEKLGIEIYGPLVCGFLIWLKQKLIEDNIRKVFFLAREGYILKELFRYFTDDTYFDVNYLYASRRSYTVPLFCTCSTLQEMLEKLACPYKMTLEDLVNRLGLNFKDVKEDFSENSIDYSYSFLSRTAGNDSIVLNFFDLIKNRVIDNSQKEYCMLKKYLEQEGVCGKIGIVDVGWNGSMQNALENLPFLKDNIEIHGYYFGISNAKMKSASKYLNGYIYENEKNRLFRYYIYSFAGIFELAFAAQHGTTLYFKEVGSRIEPVLDKHEYKDTYGSKEFDFLMNAQKGMMKFIQHYIKSPLRYIVDFNSSIAFGGCLEFGTMPRIGDTKLFENFYALDMNSKQFLINRNYNKLRGPYSIKNGLWKSTWKTAYLINLTHLRLPYYKLYCELRKKID